MTVPSVWVAALLAILNTNVWAKAASIHPAAPVTSESATLRGFAWSGGVETVAWFEWGTATNFTERTMPIDVGAGGGVRWVTASLDGLSPGTIYGCRLVISNSAGISRSLPTRFVTGGKVATFDGQGGEAVHPHPPMSGVVSISAHAGRGYALKEDGTIERWGDGGNAVFEPIGASNVIQMAASIGTTLAIKQDSTVQIWADPVWGMQELSAGLSNVVSVAAGAGHGMALLGDGTVRAFGYNGNGQTNVPTGLSNVVQIASGHHFCAALRSDGTVVSWGPTVRERSYTNIVAIAADAGYLMAISGTGEIFVEDAIFSVSSEPQAGRRWESLEAGDTQAILRDDAGSTVGLGYPAGLRFSKTVSNLYPVMFAVGAESMGLVLSTNSPPVAIGQQLGVSANQDRAIVLRGSDFDRDRVFFRIRSLPTRGALYQWSEIGTGQLIADAEALVADPEGRVIYRPPADEIGEELDSFEFIASDGQFDSTPATVKLSASGDPSANTRPPALIPNTGMRLTGAALPNGFPSVAWFEWGESTNYTRRTQIEEIGAGHSVRWVSAAVSNLAASGIFHARLVVSNRSSVAYGMDQTFGWGMKATLWGGTGPSLTNIPPGTDGLAALSASGDSILVLKTNGTVQGWGATILGLSGAWTNVIQVVAGGDAAYAQSVSGEWFGLGAAPTDMSPYSDCVSLAAVGGWVVGISSNGTLVIPPTWNPIPEEVTNVVQFAFGGGAAAALRIDGRVSTWTFYGAPAYQEFPMLTNASRVAPFWNTVSILDRDGAIRGYVGLDIKPRLPEDSTYSDLVTGFWHGLALTPTGSVRGFGDNGLRPIDIPTYLPPVAAIAAGNRFSAALVPNIAPQTFSGHYVTNAGATIPMSLMARDPNGDALSCRIASLPTRGRLLQRSGDGSAGEQVLTVGSLVTDPLRRLFYVPNDAEVGADYDSFTFAVNDGAIDSPPAAVVVSIDSETHTRQNQTWITGVGKAKLNGFFTSRAASTVWFEWGATNKFDRATPPQVYPPHTKLEFVTADIDGVPANMLHRSRMVVSNAGGIFRSAPERFTTGARVHQWGAVVGGNGTNLVGGLAGLVQLAHVTPQTSVTPYRMALRFDGTPILWSARTSLPAIPVSVTNVVSVAGGMNHFLALRSDGIVVGWGDNTYGKATPPTGLSNVVSIAAGEHHSMALRRDGTVVTWGYASTAQNRAPVGLSNVVTLGASQSSSFALKINGEFAGWGFSSALTNPPTRAKIPLERMAVGYGHIVAKGTNGSTVAWGGSANGQAPTSGLPVGLESVGAGTTGSWGITAEDRLRVWGSVPQPAPTNIAIIAAEVFQEHGATLVPNQLPVPEDHSLATAAGLDRIVRLSAVDPDSDRLVFRIATLPLSGMLYQVIGSGVRGAAITNEGTVVGDSMARVIYAPAVGEAGEGRGNFTFTVSDGDPSRPEGVVRIDVVGEPLARTLPLMPNGADSLRLGGFAVARGLPGAAWFEWGTNGSMLERTASIPLGLGTNLLHVSATISNLLAGQALTARLMVSNALGTTAGPEQGAVFGGSLVGWGKNDFGQGVGLGTNGFVSAAAGGGFNLGLTTNGGVVVWGRHSDGLFHVPPGATGIVAMAAGTNHAVALRSDGQVFVWGGNGFGQTNVPVGAAGVVAISAGLDHTLALRADGSVLAWGRNDAGQRTLPSTGGPFIDVAGGDRHSVLLSWTGSPMALGDGPALPADIGWQGNALSAGAGQSWLLRTSGELIGRGALGELDYSNVVAVSANASNAATRRSGQSWLLWGDDRFGQLQLPTNATATPALWFGHGQTLAMSATPLPPVALPTVAEGVANAGLTVQLRGHDPDGDPLEFELTSLPTTGQLFQYDAGSKGVAITAVPVEVIDSLGRVLFEPQPDSFGRSNAVWSFRVSDGTHFSEPATAVVHVDSGNRFAWTDTPGLVRADSMVLRGVAGYGGIASAGWFEVTDESGIRRTPVQTIARGQNMTRLEAEVAGLIPGAPFRARFVVSNVAGIFPGNERVLTTSAKLMEGDGTPQAGWRIFRLQADVLEAGTGWDGSAGRHVALLTNGLVWTTGIGAQAVPPGLSNVMSIAVANRFNLALKTNGSLVAWGLLPSDLTDPAALPINVVGIAAWAENAFALSPDGRVHAWGPGVYGAATVPQSLSNVVSLVPTEDAMHAILLDGRVVSWRASGSGYFEHPVPMTNAAGLAAGWYLRRDGTVARRDVAPSAASEAAATLTNVHAVATRVDTTFALLNDGKLVSLGNSLGTNSTEFFVHMKHGFAYPAALAINQPPVAHSLSVTGRANADLEIRLSGRDPETQIYQVPLGFKLHTSPTNGALYQFQTGLRGPAILPGDAITDSEGRVFYAPLPEHAGTEFDEFRVVANDGLMLSAPASVRIGLKATPASLFALSSRSVRVEGTRFAGWVSPGSIAGWTWFEWGTTTNLEQRTLATKIPWNEGLVVHRESTGPLELGRVHFFRQVISNALGTVYGPMQRFITGGKLAVWSGRAAGIAESNPGWSDVVAVSAGPGHNLAVRLNGDVAGWGTNDHGQCSVPPGLSGVVQVAAGGRHSLALKEDGTVVAWGGNQHGQCNVPTGLGNAVAIAAGERSSFALRADGSLVQWGDWPSGPWPTPTTNLVSLSVSGSLAWAADRNGDLQQWGQMGSPYMIFYGLPSGTGAVSVARGGGISGYIDREGRAHGWGVGSAPNLAGNVSNGVSIAAGEHHLAAVDLMGRVQVVGANTDDQVFVPQGVSEAVSVVASGNRTIALLPELPPVVEADEFDGGGGGPVLLQLNGSDPSGDALTFRIVGFPANGVLRQWSNGTPGDVIEPGNDVIADPGHRLFFLPASPTVERQEILSFVASDGALESPPEVVSLAPARAAFAATLPSRLAAAPGLFVLEGLATPNAGGASAWFEWGRTRRFENRTPAVPLPRSRRVQPVSASLEGLLDGRAYYFRLAVSNSAGVARGMEQALVTAGSVVAWGAGATNFPTGPGDKVGVSANTFQTLLLDRTGKAFTVGSFPFQNTDPLIAGASLLFPSDNDLAVLTWAGLFYSKSAIFALDGISSPIFRSDPITVGIAEQSRIAVFADGTIQAAGSYIPGPFVTPYGLSNVVAVTTRDSYSPGTLARPSFAVLADGSVVSFNNLDGTLARHPGITNAVAISTREGNAALLLLDGRVRRWNGASFVELDGIPETTNAFAVAASLDRIVAARRDGTVLVWPQDGSSLAAVPESALGAAQIAAGQSHVAVLVPNQPILPPRVLEIPPRLVLAYGTSTNVSLAVAGSPPLAFQWTKDGLPLPGEVSASLSLSSVTRGDAGFYRVSVTNEADAVLSESLYLRVVVPQRIGSPRHGADGVLEFSIGDAEGDGMPQSTDLVVEVAETLGGDEIEWTPLLEGEFRLDGVLWFRTAISTNSPEKFFRAVER